MRHRCLLLLLLVPAMTWADDAVFETVGHSKFRLVGQSFPDDSLFRSVAGSNSVDAAAELRLNFSAKKDGWSLHADYQLIGLASEFLPQTLPGDDFRLFDLSSTINDGNDAALVHRLDRFWVGFSGQKVVIRAGRQALSWGNGLFFAPMDLVNPFDPTAIDTEYKSGDDMLYTQYLRDNGDDVQAAVVFRRDPITADVDSEQGTVAVKYHGFSGELEYDVLLADNYGYNVLGIGVAGSLGGAVWRSDIVITDTEDDTVVELVANVSYSWIWKDRNVSGMFEYYYDGIDRHYLASGVTVEMSPLLTVTPTLVGNVDDPSALLQLVTQYSLSDNMTFLGSLNVPLGGDGTEYAGPASGIPNRYLSFDLGVFAQLAWYF